MAVEINSSGSEEGRIVTTVAAHRRPQLRPRLNRQHPQHEMSVMNASRTLKEMVLAGFLALPLLVLSDGTKAAGQTPAMTIQIFNPSSSTYNIYPVLSAGAASDTDEWMQAYFQLSNDQVSSGDYPYPRAGIPRFYINCCAPEENGIPPGGSVTVTLPLYSPLADPIKPKDKTPPGQFADWWQGGHIEMFANLKSAGSPPPALSALYKAENSPLPKSSDPPTCAGQPPKNSCALHLFFDTASIGNNVPQQLIEYTLGANPVNPKNKEPDQPHFLFDSHNVDYDVSYVNNAYLPVVMEPYGNTLIGWVGASNTIDDFTNKIQKFRDTTNLGSGWPVYKGTSKIASALEIFLDYTPDHYDPDLTKSPPVITMKALWEECYLRQGTLPICSPITHVTKLLIANYENYFERYATEPDWNCKQSVPRPRLTEKLLLTHLYGWGPFNENCAASANLLQKTPGYDNPKQTPNYQTVKKEFDQLQYWQNFPVTGIYGQFDPFVALIHGKTYIDAPYVYAYSVDDAFGNVQTDGTGMIIEVGGTDKMPNPDHFTANVHIPFGLSSTDPNKNITVTFEKYDRCATEPNTEPNTPVNPNFPSFDVPLGVKDATIKKCVITFADNYMRHYQFSVKKGPPFPPDNHNTPAGHAFIECKYNNKTPKINDTWCDNIFAWQTTDPNDPADRPVYNIQVPAPAPIAP